jgi:hypothetical protein
VVRQGGAVRIEDSHPCFLKQNMTKSKTPTKVSELIPDDKNFNKGNPFGEGLIEKSFSKFGAGRSILLDKNNRIIAGNKSTQKFAESGGEKIIVVETDGNTLVAVKRTDIDLDTPQGREMALADNMAASKNITMDAELIIAEVTEAVAVEWGVSNENFSDKNKEIDTNFNGQQYTFKLEFSEEEYTLLKEKLEAQGKTPEQIFYDALVSL